MKRLTGVALALLALLGLIACGSPTSSKSDDAAATPWKIKGTADDWTVHELTFNQISNKWTYEFTDMYATSYEFVLINPAGNEVKYGSTDAVTLEESFDMGGGSNNVKFTPAKQTYTLELTPESDTAPKVTLKGSGSTAPAVDDAALAKFLRIKGNAFTTGWTPSVAGTYDAETKTVSFVVTRDKDNKNGSFGFASIDNFLAKVNVTSPTTAGSSAAAVELLNTGGTGADSKIIDTPKANSVYTIKVAVDVTKAVNAGRYLMTVTLTDLGDLDWAFEPWSTLFLNGKGLGSTVAEWGSTQVTLTDNIGTFEFVADQATVEFKPSRATGWSGDVGIDGITEEAGSVDLSGTGNIVFSATVGNSYRIEVKFTGTYLTDGKPVVKVTDLGN